jgi:hypothetical protein
MSEIKLHPEEFELECTTVWAFPRRGNWATHKSDWRGNWSPEVAEILFCVTQKRKITCLIA